MYSIVLLVAMSSGGDVADCHRRGGCGGCGGCYGCGGGCGGCFGCGGGGFFRRHRRGWGCCGCGGGCVSVSNCCGCNGGTTTTEEPAEENGDEEESRGVRAAKPAKLIVSLPAKAKLSINGASQKKSAQTRRVFVSPKLQSGRSFAYTVRAEVVRDGKPVVVEKRVTVRAGSQVKVNLKAPEASVAQR